MSEKGKRDSNSWVKSKAHTVDKFPGHKCMSGKAGNEKGSHERLSSEHGTGARGIHHQLHNAESSLGSHTRTFRKGLPDGAPMNFKGSGKKHSKELG